MGCEHIAIPLPDGTVVRGIVCGVRERRRACVSCGARAVRLCDWKLKSKRVGATCSRGLCLRCTTSPADGKDLCPAHARIWAEHPSNPANRGKRVPGHVAPASEGG